ncbi:MAG TPA: S41 family peptidase [Anaerolineaceae bacterium]|nr:S41 family peptidase [Anaerolineaceae bacterium]HPN52727.1 S41 family peptidase [Anaerolineaceae bacterium]
MNNKVMYGCVAAFVAVILVVGSFSGGVMVGWLLPRPWQMGDQSLLQNGTETPAQDPKIVIQSDSSEGTDELFAPFWEAWNLVHKFYVDQPVDDVVLMRGAIDGMMAALGDKHTSYMDPEEYKQQTTALGGEYEGIGAWVDATQDYLTIQTPMPGYPAERAGLKPGDKVIAVDGVDMTGIDGNLVLKKVLGPAGSTVRLTILREGVEPFDVEIVREKIIVPSVEYKMLDNGIAYLRIYTFGDNTAGEVKNALADLMKKKPAGLVLDVRDNGGGYLDTTVKILSEFFEKDTLLMIERYGDGREEKLTANGGGQALGIPVVVLVNGGTASASEITAGAFQDYNRGKVVGETTYGKGSVQNWLPLSNEQGAVRITIARWFTPQGRQIHQQGIEPDVEVEMTAEDYKAGRDPQLDKAVEILTTEK